MVYWQDRARRALMLAGGLLAAAGAAQAQLRAEKVAQGLVDPVVIAADPLAAGVLFVGELAGRVRVLGGRELRAEPLLDLGGDVKRLGEQGLLGLAVSPDGRRVFASWVRKREPDGDVGDLVVTRWHRSAADPMQVDPASRRDLVWPGGTPHWLQHDTIHKGGALAFGPDGHLYIALGDDGGRADPARNAQTLSSPMGKVLRIDVDVPDDDARGYRVPSDNPFVGQPGVLGEIWSLGWRNPWRFSFDDVGPGASGAMLVGDVGERAREEINLELPGQGGRNYGWPLREGTLAGLDETLAASVLPLAEPFGDYGREVGQAVIGGYVYRGEAMLPQYRGRYFFADYPGRIYSFGFAADGRGGITLVDARNHTEELGSPRLVPTFGRDRDGELYFTSFVGGTVWKLVSDAAPPPAPQNVDVQVEGAVVQVAWEPGSGGGGAAQYLVEAGTRPGESDIGIFATTDEKIVFEGVGVGTYHVRVRAQNTLGTSAAAGEALVVVSCSAPAPVDDLRIEVAAGGAVTLSWPLLDGIAAYRIEVGSQPGLSNAAVFEPVLPPFTADAPAGVYYLRVRAINDCGPGPRPDDTTLVVP